MLIPSFLLRCGGLGLATPKIIFGIVLFFSSNSSAQSIFTIAGGGTDDGRPATAAALDPFGLAVDGSGNLYIADYINNRIRKVGASTGIITTVAGIGTRGFFGDGGPAIKASLDLPTGVALDSSGNLYMADAWNHRIRKVTAATGIITTVAGTGAFSFFGDGGPATAAALRYPWGVALDGLGNLYIADHDNHRIRKVTAATGIITTVAGTDAQGFSGDGGPATAAALSLPEGVALDGSGNLYIADRDNHRIRKVAAATGIITTVAGNGTQSFYGDEGPATAAALNSPSSVALDGSGNLYIADHGNHRIRKVTAVTGIITTVAGSGLGGFRGDGGPAAAASLPFPRGVALDGPGNLYVADRENTRIRKVSAASEIITTVAGSGARTIFGDGGPALAASLGDPGAIALDGSISLYIADRNFSNRIRKVTAATGIITTVAGTDTQGFSGDGGPATTASLTLPGGVAVDGAGNLYIADTFNNRIRKVTAATGFITTVAGNGTQGFSGDGGPATAATLSHPEAVALDGSGDLYIADLDNHRVRKVTAGTGIITTVAGSGTQGFSGDGAPATAGALSFPSGVALDISGNLYIADRLNHRIRKVTAGTGIITTVAGTGSQGFSGEGGSATAAALNVPIGVAVDGLGNVYIADTFNHRIRKVPAATGIIKTVAGSGAPAFSGDGGPATAAALNQPSGVALDSSGNLYIADSFNKRIRAVFACINVGASSLLAPADRGQDVGLSPNLSWSSVPGAFRYDLFLDTFSPPARLVAADLTSTSFTPSNLLGGTEYFWRVVAKGDRFCPFLSTSSSAVRSFTTLASCTAPGGFDLSQPANGTSGVGSSTQLSWQPASGAATYDVYVGSSNPPPLFAKGVSATTQNVSGLTASTTYYWHVVAHAACDATKTTASPTRSFQTAGGCAAAGAFSLTSPSKGATGVSNTTTLDWSSSSNASSYDVYFGTSSPPPLYLLDVPTPRVGVAGLAPSTTYSWHVVAKVACDALKSLSSPTRTFTTAGGCTTPGATSIVFVPPGKVGVGQTYTVAWQELPELDADGHYLVERSTSSSFGTILDSQQSFSTSASFISSTAGTYYHRVRAVPGCDPAHPGPVSPVKSVNVVTGTANVIFTVQPQAVITTLGDKLEDQKARFTLENLGSSALQVILGKAEINSVPFFAWRDLLGGDPVFVTLDPRTPKSFDIQFSGPPNDIAAAYQGIIFVAATGQGLAITPYAFVNLKVGGGTTSRPKFLLNGQATEYAFFPGFAGDDANRPPIAIEISNDGSASMELGAEIGPEVWLVPESGWNATPIPPGASRPVRLKTQRSRAPNGSALPRYTYFTVRSKNGETARLLVQDNDELPTSLGRTSLLDPGSRSFIVPGVVSTPPQFSRLRITNVGSDPVQTDLFFTPAGADGLNAAAVKRATIVIPPNDVVTLTDPLVQVFGVTGPAQGQIEVRAAPQKIGFLVVSSSVLTLVTTGGQYSYEMPTLVLGEGARLGSSHVIAGVAANSTTRTALTLAETTGTELTRVRAVLFDAQGARKGDRLVDVPRYGQTRIDNVITVLGGSEPLDGGRIELNAESGGGAVTGVVTILDATRNNGAAPVSQPAAGTVSSSAYTRLRRARAAFANVSVTAVAPIVVNGPSSTGAIQRTTMGFTVTTGSPKTAVVTYRPSDPATSSIDKTLQLPTGVTLQFDNVLEDLFGIPRGQAARGSVFIQASVGAQIYARLATLTGTSWIVGSGLPIVPTLSDALSSIGSKRPLYLDGLEQSIDPTRGTRWSVDINEIGGGSGSVLVRLYEAGNRSVPIAEKRYNIAAYQQLTLDTVFFKLGLDSDDRRKDRTNVLCAVSADGGNALISAVGAAIDNRTGDKRHFVFSPTGGVPSTGVLRITTVTPVLPTTPSTGRRRAVRP